MDCYTCEQLAINACKRCAKPYCEDHGNAVYCSECLTPASALPSFNLYRGALLVMLVGTALAVVLLLRPPGEGKSASPVVVGKSGLTPATGGSASATVAVKSPGASVTPAETETPGTQSPTTGTPTAGTPTPGGTPGATPAGTVSPFNVYIVESGDNLLGIAEQFLAPGDDVRAFATAIANLNGLDPVDPLLRIGQKLLLPKPR